MLRGPARYLPQVALATFLVVGLPALIVAALGKAVHVPAVAAILLAILLSLAFSRLGAAVWMRTPGSRDIVFGDLMVWGWLRRMRAERRLEEAEQLLGEGGLSTKQHAELLTSLAAGLEARDPYTAGHSARVARHAEAIAREMGLPRELVAKVRTAAAVHDVGKIRTPRKLLTKPGRLTGTERAVMEKHARVGAGMVAGLGDPQVTAMVEFHHERLDGSGYPDGLAAEEIPLGARIIAVADTFDAITSSRPYSPGQRHKSAMDVLEQESQERLDPRAVAAFRRHYSGERAVPVSALLAAGPQRLGSWLAGVVQGEGALPLAQGLSALGAAALLGGSMLGGGPSGDGAREQSADSGAATAAGAPVRLLDDLDPRGLPGDGAGAGARGPGGGRREGAPRERSTREAPPGRGGGGDGAPAQPPGGSAPGATQPAEPPRPERPPGDGQLVPPPGGAPAGPVRPTVTLTPDQAQIGVGVRPPELPVPVRVPHVDASVSIDLPKGGQVSLPGVQLGLR